MATFEFNPKMELGLLSLSEQIAFLQAISHSVIGCSTIPRDELIILLDGICTKKEGEYYFNGPNMKPEISIPGIPPRPTLQSHRGLYIKIEDVPHSACGEFIVIFTYKGSTKEGDRLLQLFLNNTKEIQINM